MERTTVKNQRGSVLLMLIAGIATLGVLAMIGSTLLTTLISGNQRSSLNIATGQILTQASYTITAETNTSGSYPVAAVPTAWSGTTPSIAPSMGTANSVGLITATSAAPKVDAWGSAIGYCTYTAAAQGNPVFAIISAGPDKIFQTTCTQAFANTPQGDDGVRTKTAANIAQGVGGTIYYKDPVATEAALATIAAPAAGESRYVLADKMSWTNPTGVAGAVGVTWFPSGPVPGVTAAATCTYPIGTMGKDVAGVIYTCQ